MGQELAAAYNQVEGLAKGNSLPLSQGLVCFQTITGKNLFGWDGALSGSTLPSISSIYNNNICYVHAKEGQSHGSRKLMYEPMFSKPDPIVKI